MMTAVLEHPWQSDAVAESSVGPADEENLSSKASSSVCSCNFGLVVLGFFFLYTHRFFLLPGKLIIIFYFYIILRAASLTTLI